MVITTSVSKRSGTNVQDVGAGVGPPPFRLVIVKPLEFAFALAFALELPPVRVKPKPLFGTAAGVGAVPIVKPPDAVGGGVPIVNN